MPARATAASKRVRLSGGYSQGRPHYHFVATSATGTGTGGEQTFTTPGPVEAVTATATGVGQTEATLNGTVNPRGFDAKYYFQYGTSTEYTSSTSQGDAGGGEGAVPVSAAIAALEPGTTYHFRLVASSGGVTSYGGDQAFTTLPAIDVFYRATNGGLRNEYWNGTAWFLGEVGSANVMAGNPAAVEW
jgi:hypothetical protein